MSSTELSVAEAPLGYSPFSDTPSANGYFFDPAVTVLSQYANSPIILALIDAFAQWLDPGSRFDSFYNLMWNIDTAVGYGLDVWGRILGVNRVLQVASSKFIGFSTDSAAQTFGHGIWYSGQKATSNVALTDDAYRMLLLAKAALNITNASIPAINAILLNLFGQGYVIDNQDMTMVYHFTAPLTPVETSIVYQSGVLPKPAGVSFSVEHP